MLPAAPMKGPPAREIVVADLDSVARWHSHDFPHPLARWHSHPEVEIHLITESTGSAFIGDYVGRFSPGHLVAVGAHLPHNWISDVGAAEVIRGRDIVLQIHPNHFRRLAEVAPELIEAVTFFTSIRHGVEYVGETARQAASELRAIGNEHGLARLARLFRLLDILRSAPFDDRIDLSRRAAVSGPNRVAQERVDVILSYITANLAGNVTLDEAARLVAMTPSSLSRFFRAAAGRGFGDTIRRLRILQACDLLATTEQTILAISEQVGYLNLSNFNRQFRAEIGQTPRQYRSALGR